MKFKQSLLKTDIGNLLLTFSDEGIHTIQFNAKDGDVIFEQSDKNQYVDQLEEYFLGKRKSFDFPFILVGTPFQVSVWKYIQKIPFGKTQTYKEIAEGIEHTGSSRAVGNALHVNPIPIVIPCHRVIRSDGGLGGFGGGIHLKQKLLEFEKEHV
ncbi:MAG TPA: methylated-DNA--[protein]-cysteine S-methyltransferase [Candidatus Cloacimonetes bacterium]|nr:methylated-DNA--[protein]-cysteine S-methyltransferase [Candidatus Cloacimonadota bacterium]HEX38319.1 methylated-DNA--[protein]-cysteine S-methyltransferase [Candidatus Cloacimonadota bacterium]